MEPACCTATAAQNRQSKERLTHFAFLQVSARICKEAPQGGQRRIKENKEEEITGISVCCCWLPSLRTQFLEEQMYYLA